MSPFLFKFKIMGKAIRNIFKNDRFLLSEVSDGYYLYDYALSMNISMRAKTEQDAFIEALTYYQKRLQQVKLEHKNLSDKVEDFLSKFKEDE